jgi:hypothetical protein
MLCSRSASVLLLRAPALRLAAFADRTTASRFDGIGVKVPFRSSAV